MRSRSSLSTPPLHHQLQRVRNTLLWLTLTAGLSCGDSTTEPSPPPPPPPPPQPATVSVTPAEVELTALGATAQLTADVRDGSGRPLAGATVAWSSGGASVATVNASGLVTAAGNGTATVTATAGSVSGTATVRVAQEVGVVSVSPAADTLVAQGDTVRLTAEATDGNGHVVAGAEFTWASSDGAVATVDAAGLVTSVSAGEAEVTATTSGFAGGAALTVVNPAPTTAAITPDEVALTALGQTAQLAAVVRDQIERVIEGRDRLLVEFGYGCRRRRCCGAGYGCGRGRGHGHGERGRGLCGGAGDGDAVDRLGRRDSGGSRGFAWRHVTSGRESV